MNTSIRCKCCTPTYQSVHTLEVVLLLCFRKFSLDDLLTNVMIYWTSGSITSSMRFYKENFGKGLNEPHTK